MVAETPYAHLSVPIMIEIENITGSIPLPTAFLPCLAIPFVELFPGLCLGWWTPPSLNLKRYKKL